MLSVFNFKFGSRNSQSWKTVKTVPDISALLTKDVMRNYKKEELLGRGGFGKVWKVKQKRSKTIYAMKVINSKRHDLMELTAREVLIMRELNHPCVVRLDHSFLSDGKLVLILEYCDIGSLKQLLNAFGKLDEVATAKIFSDVCDGLIYLHKKSIIHCDIKPSNILLTTEGLAKIIDFGIALGPGQFHRNCFCGSDAYAAPETYLSKQYTFQCDIWSVGVVLYEMMTGRLPFGNKLEVMENDLKLPSHTSYAAQYLIRGLIQVTPSNRLSLEEAKEGWTMLHQQKFEKYQTVVWAWYQFVLKDFLGSSGAFLKAAAFKNGAYHMLEFISS